MDMSILEDLGLTNGEIKVYLALYELGSSLAGLIIEKTNLQNSVVHRALHSLIAKGLITYSIEGRGRTYQISDPRNFIGYLEDKKRKFEEIIPELEKRKKAAKEIKEAITFKGNKRIGKKIKSRQVFDITIEAYGESLNKLPYTEIRFLPQEFEQLSETVIIGDYVAIAIFTKDPYGILIHDKDAAEGYRKHFELLWKSAKK